MTLPCNLPGGALARPLSLALLFSLAGCGGGGGGGDSSPPRGSDSGGTTWQEGVFLSPETFANRCEAPRVGSDFPDVQGSALDEKNWLRSWSNDLYLWYDEIEDRNPANYEVLDYFDLLKTEELTDSGAPKDNFHFAMPTDEYVARSQSGVSVGYGFQWALLAAAPPREARIAYQDSPDPALPPRGSQVLEVDGVDFRNAGDQASVDRINAAFFPDTAGESHTFLFEYPDGTFVEQELVSAELSIDPVQNVKVVEGHMGTRVGYMLFTDHIATAEQELFEAVEYLQGQQVEELVLDLRYNGGGYLAIASQLAYMIAGDVPTAGQAFEQLVFNDKHPETNPVTGEPLDPYPFIDETVFGAGLAEGQPLPTLDLPRVFVLTGGGTCSASEAVINGLRGVDVQVIQVGDRTCGKPYGFYPADNCGTTYFSIQFQGVNAKGFGDYADGFAPGCRVGDDFSRALGDPAERRFAAALGYLELGGCNTSFAAAGDGAATTSRDGKALPDAVVHKPVWRENRIFRR